MAKFTGSPALLPRQRPIHSQPRPLHAERPVQASRAVHAEPEHPVNLAHLFPYQAEGVRWLHRRIRALLSDDMGLGKLQRTTCKVLTPSGWRAIGDLRVGDPVCDPDGGVAHVEGVFPQGVCDLYRVTMKDGGSTEAGGEHLWGVSTALDRYRRRPLRVLSTDALRAGLTIETSRPGQPNSRWFTPVAKVVTFDDPGPLPVPPYLLGVLLGDGCLSNANIRWTNPDAEVFERLLPLLPPGVVARRAKPKPSGKSLCPTWSLVKVSGTTQSGPNPLIGAMRALGLMGTLSIHKHVPPQYLRASAADRLLLLQGLMDTDGDATKLGHCTANTSSPRLRDALVDLVRSLGGVATVSTKLAPKYTYKGENRTGATAYRVSVALPVCPFLLRRKAERWRPHSIERTRAIESIEPSGSGECVCIKVGSRRQLYVTDDYVVTHNTATALRALPHGHGTIVVCPAGVRFNWASEVFLFRSDLGVAVSKGVDHLREKFLDEEDVRSKFQAGRYPTFNDENRCVEQARAFASRVRSFEPGTLPAPGSHEVVIVSYDGLPDLPQQRDPKWLVPHALGDVTLVLDEAHRVKNKTADRTKKVRLLRRQVARVWGLTGTPMMGKPDDLWGVLESLGLHKAVFGNFSGFLRAFGAKRRYFGGFDYAPEPVEDVAAMLKPVMLRRLKKDVMPELPPKVYVDLEVEVDPAIFAELDAADAAWKALGTDELPPITLFSSVRAKLAESRIEAVKDFCESYEENEVPLVVFCSHSAPLRELVGGDFGQPREGWGCITGETSQKMRDVYVDLFQAGMLRGLAVATQAGGVGLTLTRASHALFVDLSFTPSDNAQAEDRLLRIGQKAKSIQITRMVANHAVDRRLTSRLQGKTTQIDATLGDSAK